MNRFPYLRITNGWQRTKRTPDGFEDVLGEAYWYLDRYVDLGNSPYGAPPVGSTTTILEPTTAAPGETTTVYIPPSTLPAGTTTEVPFTANASITQTYNIGAEYGFRGDATYSSSTPVGYSWNFNDTGTYLSGKEVSYTFSSNGTFVVSLSVSFANGQVAYSSIGVVVSGAVATTQPTTTTQGGTTPTTIAGTTTSDPTLIDKTKTTSVTLYREKVNSTNYYSKWTFSSGTLLNSSGNTVSSYYTFDAVAVTIDPDTGGEMLIPLGTVTGPGDITLTRSSAYNYDLEVNVLRGGVRVGAFTIPKSAINWTTGSPSTENLTITWVNRA